MLEGMAVFGVVALLVYFAFFVRGGNGRSDDERGGGQVDDD